MTEKETWKRAAAEALATIKVANPRFPNPDPDGRRAGVWGYVFSRSGLPPWMPLWVEAVGDYFCHHQGDAIPAPADIVQAAKRVRDRQETDPEKKQRWEQWRQLRRDEIDQQIATGTHRLQVESKHRTDEPRPAQQFDIQKVIERARKGRNIT